MKGLRLNSRKSCYICKWKAPRLERHHIFSEMYFLRHGVGNIKTYQAFKRCVAICRSCHSQITSLNSLFRQSYWKMLGRHRNIDRSCAEYEELMRILGTIVWNVFLKVRPLRYKGQRRALVEVLLNKYKLQALLTLRKAS